MQELNENQVEYLRKTALNEAMFALKRAAKVGCDVYAGIYLRSSTRYEQVIQRIILLHINIYSIVRL